MEHTGLARKKRKGKRCVERAERKRERRICYGGHEVGYHLRNIVSRAAHSKTALDSANDQDDDDQRVIVDSTERQ